MNLPCETRALCFPPWKFNTLDFAVWQREWLQGEVLDRNSSSGETNWRRYPTDLPPDLCVPSGLRTASPCRMATRPGIDRQAESVEPAGRRDSLHDLADGFDLVLSRYRGRRTLRLEPGLPTGTTRVRNN